MSSTKNRKNFLHLTVGLLVVAGVASCGDSGDTSTRSKNATIAAACLTFDDAQKEQGIFTYEACSEASNVLVQQGATTWQAFFDSDKLTSSVSLAGTEDTSMDVVAVDSKGATVTRARISRTNGVYSVEVIEDHSAQAIGAATTTPVAPPPSCAEGGTCAVGDIGPGGGYVFYAAATPQPWGQYIEAHPKPVAITLACAQNSPQVYTSTGAIGNGLADTKIIASTCTDSLAAKVLAATVGGKSDWFIPSKSELDALNGFFGSHADIKSKFTFGPAELWSSTFTNYKSANGWHFVYIRDFRTPITKWVSSNPWLAGIPVRYFGEQAQPVSPTTPTTAAPTATKQLLAPTNLSAVVTGNQIALSFNHDDVSGLAADRFELVTTFDGVDYPSTIQKGGATLFFIDALRGTKQKYVVAAIAGDKRAASDSITITIPLLPVVPTDTPTTTPAPDATVTDGNNVLNQDNPVIVLEPGDMIITLDPEIVLSDAQVISNNATPAKVEVRTGKSEWTEVRSSGAASKITVPADADTFEIRVTDAAGVETIVSKPILRTDNLPEPKSSASSSTSSDDSSSSTLYVIIGLAVIVVAGAGLFLRRRKS